uniref:Receptor-like protein kinase ANXUR2-like n=1 Tax=Saccoglossus kowalevskii TaxID=10224 RepID=A0ABM0M650_SACKO|nr:PREDICTED: receptor-like protein kinase ANXUR2-like [Saccoglossus kowalevskii]
MDEKKSLSVQSFCSSDENNESPCAENNTDTSTAHASIYTDELPIPLYIGPINANVVQHSLLEVRGAACRELPTQTFRLQSFVQRDYTRPYANENNFNVDISHMYASNEAHVSSEVKHLNITDDGKNGMGILKTCLVYEYSKVMKATNEFDVMNIMHKGQFGAIFHGTMFGQIFGMLRITSEEVNSEGEVVILYENEISALMMFRHPSIIMLQGSAFSGNDAVLIYEYLSVGTFADWLHSSVQDPLVRCYESLAVLTGVASALSYLHNVLQFPFIHGSVNSYHILLGDNLKPKLFGFWCSHYCLGSRCINVVDMNMIEKYQYKAFMPGGLVPSFIHSPRIDIYGLRAIMYDVLCGRTDTISEAPGSEETIFEDFVSQPYENLKRQMKLNTSKWPEDIVRGLYGLIWKCLQQCIGDKQENIQEIHECLERLTRRRSDTSEMAGMFNVAAQTAFHVL